MIGPDQAAELAAEIEKRLKRSKLDIPVGVSNRHCHLTEAPTTEPRRLDQIRNISKVGES